MNTVRLAQRRRLKTSMVVLAGLVLLFIWLYQFAFVNPKFFAYAMGLRLPRLAVILIAGFAISAAAIVFQTIIRNTIVTPCLLGMNSLYLLIHTAVVFFLGSGSLFAVNPVYAFAADVIVMGVVAGFIYYTIFQKTGGNVLYVLLIGTVLSTFFSSMQNSLTRIMDPNEYDALLNTLTGAGILAQDKLFATLDPTTRGLKLASGQEILLTDTVGFIRKLPHHLIEAFKSTLEEARYSDIVLHVVDASNPQMDTQMYVVYDTLRQLKIGDKTVVTVFNKMDQVEQPETLKDLHSDYQVQISAKTGAGLDELKDILEMILRNRKIYLEKVFSYQEAGRIQTIRKYGQLLKEEYREDGIYVEAYVPTELYAGLMR